MQLHGIATALYDDKEGRTNISVTTLNSNGADDIFIESSQKIEVNPSQPKEARNALKTVLDEICRQPPQRAVMQGGDYKGREAIIPVEVIYGTPFKHPEAIYRTMILDAFPEYFPKGKKTRNKKVSELLGNLLHKYYKLHSQPGARIESHDYYLYRPEHNGNRVPTEKDEEVNAEFLRLHEDAKSGNADALLTLKGYARTAGRSCAEELEKEGRLDTTRFVNYGLNGNYTMRYEALDWFNLKDIFVEELVRHMKMPHNICVKTPNDMPAPPFADICATYLADQWNILEGVSKPRNVYAKPIAVAA